MHTIMIIGAGLALFAACLALSHRTGSGGIVTGIKIFLPLWFVLAGINMWVGVTRAGYSVAQEFPVFVIVFAVPAIVALLVWWMRGRG